MVSIFFLPENTPMAGRYQIQSTGGFRTRNYHGFRTVSRMPARGTVGTIGWSEAEQPWLPYLPPASEQNRCLHSTQTSPLGEQQTRLWATRANTRERRYVECFRKMTANKKKCPLWSPSAMTAHVSSRNFKRRSHYRTAKVWKPFLQRLQPILQQVLVDGALPPPSPR